MTKFNSYWYKSGSLIMLQKGSNLIIGFIAFYLLVRLLSKEDYGIWILFISITSLIELARNGLIQNGLIRYLVGADSEEAKKIICASFTLSIIITLFIIILLIGLAFLLSVLWNSPQLKYLFLVYIITLLLYIPFFQFQFIEQSYLNFTGVFFSNLIKQFLFLSYIVSAIIFNYELLLINLALMQSISVFFGSLVSYFFVRKYLVINLNISKYWVWKLFHYGKYVFGTNISSQVPKSIDQAMIGTLLNPASVASLNIAIRIANLVELPTQTLSNIVFPQSAKRIKEQGKHAVKYLYEKSVGILLAILIPSLLIIFLFPDFIIKIIAGESYMEVVPILKVTLVYSLMVPFNRQFGTTLDSIGKPNITFYMVLSTAFLNIGFNYIFIIKFGVIGAAYGTLVTNIISFIVGQIILYRELNINILSTLKQAINFYLKSTNWISKLVIKSNL